MATRAKTRRTADRVSTVRMIIAGYELDDESIDKVIELTFRTFERMLRNEHLIRAIHLYNQARRVGVFD